MYMGASMRLSEVAREALRLQRQLLQEPSLRRNRAHGQRLVRVGLQRHSGAKAQGGQQHGSVVTCEGILKKPVLFGNCFLSFFSSRCSKCSRWPCVTTHGALHTQSQRKTRGVGGWLRRKRQVRGPRGGVRAVPESRFAAPITHPHHARGTPHPHHARVPHDGHGRRSARGPWSTWPVRLGRARQKGGWSGPSENARSR